MRDGREIQPLEGVSLAPALKGQPLRRNRPIFWEHEGNRAIREGNWKLVAKGRNGPWELYDVEDDRTESNDLAADQPYRVREMASQWEHWARRTHVKPWPPRNQPAAARARNAVKKAARLAAQRATAAQAAATPVAPPEPAAQ